MKKKKIAFVVAIAGTAQAFLKDHISYLIQEYDVHLVANFKQEEKGEFEQMGVICHDAPIERPISFVHDLKALFALRRLFNKEKFECVHSVTPKAGLLTALAGWMARVPNRVHIFTGQVWATRKGVMRTILKMMDKVIAGLDTLLLVDGQGQRQFLINEGVLKDTNSAVPANGSIAGIKLERYVRSEEVRKRERENLGFNEEDIVFVFLGRLNHDKGIGELFEAFNQMLPKMPNAKLLLYGTDEEGYDQKVNAYDNIKRGVNYFYPGRTSRPFEALQAGDIYVIPTWREGFGVSVLEAQALGLPVITSDAYGVVDASVEGETGMRCKVGDVPSLIESMTYYYNHPDVARQHGQAGRKRVEEYFDNAVVSQAWMDIYKGLMG